MANRKCNPIPELTPSDIERFWPKVDRSGGPDACWEWLRYRNTRGYGRLSLNGGGVGAHRVAWKIAHRASTGTLDVLHACDNPACCNPAHLFLGTQLDNMKDMHQKGRHAHGRTVHTARLHEDTVRFIRNAVAGGESQLSLARYFGVTTSAICNIVSRKSWMHVCDEVSA